MASITLDNDGAVGPVVVYTLPAGQGEGTFFLINDSNSAIRGTISSPSPSEAPVSVGDFVLDGNSYLSFTASNSGATDHTIDVTLATTHMTTAQVGQMLHVAFNGTTAN